MLNQKANLVRFESLRIKNANLQGYGFFNDGQTSKVVYILLQHLPYAFKASVHVICFYTVQVNPAA